MGCHSIPFRRLPHSPRLFVRFVDDFSSVAKFYAHPPSMEVVEEVSKTLDFPVERRKGVTAILREQNAAFGGSPATQSNLDGLEKGAVAVVSGQQGAVRGAGIRVLQGADRDPTCSRIEAS